MNTYTLAYTGSEIDNKLNNTYTKTEIDTNIYTKVQIDTQLSNIYTKSQIDAQLSNIYTKSQIDTSLNNIYTKSQIDNSIYTKTQVNNLLKVPALLTYTNDTQLSIAASAWNNVTSMTLTPGAWILSAFTHCSLPSAFQAYMEITTSGTHDYTDAICGTFTYYNAAGTPDLGCTGMMLVTSNTPVYLWMYGNKAITITAGYINMRAMRVGDA